MKTGWSEKVRDVADREFVRPALPNRSRVRIRFGDLQAKMQQLGFPAQHPNQVATSIESKKFWEPRGLEMCSPRGQSRKIDAIFEFKFKDEPINLLSEGNDPLLELVGFLKGAIREGADAFIRDIRTDKKAMR